MSAIMCIGSWYATSCTKLPSPRSRARSTIATAHSRAWASRSAVIRGVNPALTSFRRRVWSGGSIDTSIAPRRSGAISGSDGPS